MHGSQYYLYLFFSLLITLQHLILPYILFDTE
jgi:hypothetical protein